MTCSGGIVADLAGGDEGRGGQLDVAQVLRNLGGLGEAASYQGDLAVELVGHLGGQLDAVDGRRKAGDEKPAAGVEKDLLEFGTHHAFAGGGAGAFDVGRVLHQRQHALLAVFGEGVQVKHPVVGGREIDLEIAGVDDDAQRRMHGDRDGVHNGVRDLDGMNREWTELEAFSGHHLVEFGVIQQAVLFELVLHVGEGELGGVDGNVEFGDEPGNSRRCGLRGRG